MGSPSEGGGKRLLWYGPGSRAPFAGRVLVGMFYVAEGTGIPCVLDARLPVLDRPPIPRETARSPSYATLSPEHRSMLLAWYEGGRITADVPTGIALLHLFSLERRLLVGNPAEEEAGLIRREVRRLIRLFENDTVFRKYASVLLEEADRRSVMTGEKPIILLSTRRHSMTAGLRLHIARMAMAHTPLGFDEAMAGWLGMGNTDDGREGEVLRPRLSNTDVPELVTACAARWSTSFPQGLLLNTTGIPRLPQHSYIPGMWGLRPLIMTHDSELPDPQAADWRRMGAFIASVWTALSSTRRVEKKAPAPAYQRAAGVKAGISNPLAAGATAWLSGLGEHAVMTRTELTSNLMGGGVSPTRRILSQAAALLSTRGWGMEPDPLWAEPLAPKDSPAFIFRLDSREERSEHVRWEWPLAVLLWTAVDEDPTRFRDACTIAACTMDMRRRLRLCSGWWEPGPKARRTRMKWAARTLAAMEKAEECLDILTAFLRGGDALPSDTGMSILEDVSRTMGLGSPWSRVMGLEKPRATRKGKKPPSDVVMMGGGDIVPEGRAIPAPSSFIIPAGRPSLPLPNANLTQNQPLTSFVLDPEILERVERETKEATDILAAVWEDDVPLVVNQPSCPSGDYDGLSPSAAKLLSVLLSADAWNTQSLAEAAAIEGLKPGGAVEAINEWSWSRIDAAILEDDGEGGVLVDREAASLLNTR